MKAGLKFEWLRPVDVRVDENVQRKFDQAHGNRLAKAYDPLLFTIGHVSLRADGLYYVIDAQHRCYAAVQSGQGDVKVLFQVYRGLTTAEEADLFLKLNANKKSVSALDSFNVGVKAGHPVNVDIVRILKSFGLRTAHHRSDGGVSSVVALIHIYHGRVGTKPSTESVTSPAPGMPESQLLSRTLNVLVNAFGKDRDGFDGALLRGVASLLVKHDPRVDAAHLAKALKKTPPGMTLVNIRGLASLGHKSPTVAAVEYLEGIYDHGRSESRRLSP